RCGGGGKRRGKDLIAMEQIPYPWLHPACGTMSDAFLQRGCPKCASHSGKRCSSCLSAPPGSTLQAPGPALSTLNISCMSLDLTAVPNTGGGIRAAEFGFVQK
ncbi:hypothetical protein HGM15179_010506, partial [Zosterops borbonicus]